MAKLRPTTRDPLALGLGLLAIALGAMRFVRLGEWGLWIDEAFTLADSLHGASFANPLGYEVFERYLHGLGHRPSEAELRLIPALAGWACIPALWWALRSSLGARAGAAAGLLLATSGWHLYWSQSARFYTLAMLLSVIGMGLVLRAYASGRWPQFVVGVAVAGSAALAHQTAVFVLPGALLAPFVLRRAGVDPGRGLRRAALAMMALGGMVGSVWAIQVLGKWTIIKPGGGSPAHLALTTGFYATPLLGAAALVGACVGVYRRQRGAIVALCVAGIGLAMAMAVATVGRVAAQYVFLLLPWVIALATIPLATGTSFSGPRESDGEGVPWPTPAGPALLNHPAMSLAWLAVLVLPALTNCALYLGPRHGERPRWKDAYTTVFNEREVGDLVLGMAAPVGEYYLAPDRTDLRDMREVVYLDKFRADVPLFWDRFARRTWFVVNREELQDWPSEDRRRMLRMLREDCRLVADYPLFVESRDLSVAVYVRD